MVTVEVIAAPLDVSARALGALSRWLCDAERSRAARFHFERDRRRFVVARARLRELLGERLGVHPAAVALACGRRGKPVLAERFAGTGWSFNLSHCDELAVYALARCGEVGIDVEAIRPLDEADDIAARFFSRREHKCYHAAAPEDRPLEFFRCWTRKEALAKALGEGLGAPLEALDASQPFARSGWSVESFSPRPGYIGAVASRLRAG